MVATNDWCVKTETVKYDLEALGKKFWIEIKCELSIGEQRRADTGGFRGVSTQAPSEPADRPGVQAEKGRTEIGVDWKNQSFARTLVYLVDWSLKDSNDDKLPIEASVIEALRKPVFKAIEAAINKHVEQQEALEKKDQPGGAGR